MNYAWPPNIAHALDAGLPLCFNRISLSRASDAQRKLPHYAHGQNSNPGITMKNEIIRIGQIGIRFLLDAAGTGGSVAMLQFTVPVGAKVPPNQPDHCTRRRDNDPVSCCSSLARHQ